MRALIWVTIIFLSVHAFGQEPMRPLGIFGNHMDVGNPTPPGEVSYDSQTGEYIVKGGGTIPAHTGHFVYSEVRGDFSISAKISVEDQGGSHPQATVLLHVMNDLVQDTVYFAAGVSLNGDTHCSWQSALGRQAEFTNPVFAGLHDGRLKLVREGNMVSMYYMDPSAENWTLHHQLELDLSDSVYVGLAVTSYQASGTTVGYFTEVKLIVDGIPVEPPSCVNDWGLYE